MDSALPATLITIQIAGTMGPDRNWVATKPTSQMTPVVIRVMVAPLPANEWRVFCVILWMAASASSASSGEMFTWLLLQSTLHYRVLYTTIQVLSRGEKRGILQLG